jgi:hypothetical protein
MEAAMMFETLRAKLRIFAFVLLLLGAFFAAFSAINLNILPQHTVLAALGGLSIGLLIEVLAGANFGNSSDEFQAHFKGAESEDPTLHGLISEYIGTVGIVLQRAESEHRWNEIDRRQHEKTLSQAAHLSRQIIELDEMSRDEVQVVLETQKLLVSYMLAPRFDIATDLVPKILDRLGHLTPAGPGNARRSEGSSDATIPASSL